MKRLALLSYHTSPLLEPGTGDAGGMTVYVRALSSALASRGISTDIFVRATSPEDRITFLDERVRVIPVDAGPRSDVPKEEIPVHIDEFVASVRAFVMVQRIAYDVVHAHYWQSGVAGAVLSAAWDAPFVYSPHTLARMKNASLAPGDLPEPEMRVNGEQAVIDAASMVIASSEPECAALACMYKVSHDQVKVLSPGVDHELFTPGDKASARERLGLPAEERAVLALVGRIQPLKGVDLAIRATAALRDRLATPPLLAIAGGASGANGSLELEKLRRLVDELSLGDDVVFLGPLPHHELPDVYRAADALLVCSHSESFGLTVLEAQACGCPVVGTDVGGSSYVVRQGRTGFILDERDPEAFAIALEKIITDAALAGSFAEAAAVGSRRFSWDATAVAYIELYECLLTARHPEICSC